MSLKFGGKSPESILDEDPESFAKWQAYHKVEPWGGEKELLCKCVALLQMLVWAKYSEDSSKADKCVKQIVQSLMPADWIGQPEAIEQSAGDSLVAFETIVSKAFG